MAERPRRIDWYPGPGELNFSALVETLKARLRSQVLLNAVLVVVASVLTVVAVDQALALMGYADQWHILTREPNLDTFADGIRVRTNSHGFRYRPIPWVKPDNETRVLVIGDSLTEGHGVEAEVRFSNLLEDRFGFPFINFGQGGKEPRWYFLAFDVFGRRYESDWVLICFFVNDLFESLSHSVIPSQVGFEASVNAAANVDLLRRQMQAFNPLELTLRRTVPRIFVLLQKMFGYYVDPWRVIRARVFPSGARNDEAPATELEKIIRSSKVDPSISDDHLDTWLAGLSSQTRALINANKVHGSFVTIGLQFPDFWRVSLDIDNEQGEVGWRNAEQWLEMTFDRVRQTDARPLLAFLPHPTQYDPAFLRPEYIETGTVLRSEWLTEESELQRRLNKLGARLEVPFLDLTPGFRAYTGAATELYLPYGDPHFSPAGNLLAADLIDKWLQDLGLTPTQR